MRKTLIALAIGLVALVAAACNNGGSGSSTAPLDTFAPAESPAMSPGDVVPSPSDMLESPSAS